MVRLSGFARGREAGHWLGSSGGHHVVRLPDRHHAEADGNGVARYQDVETHPAARRQGLAGTLVRQAGRYALAQLAARTLVIVTEPDQQAIRVYRSCGFEVTQDQVSFERAPEGS
jgi:ribosomal protein S18 acetylase RimI-like enzyme